MAPRKKKQTKPKGATKLKEAAKTSIHPVLRVKQFVRAVADEVGAKNGRTLVSMALACRALFDPAMDTLWRDLGDPMRLVRVLPEHAFTLERDSSTALTTVEIVEDPSKADWKRFSDYARRVEVLRSHDRSSHWCSVLDFYQGSKLFPKLWLYVSTSPFQCDHHEVFITTTLRLEQFETTFPVPQSLPTLASFSRLAFLNFAIDDLDLGDVSQHAFPALQYLRVVVVKDFEQLIALMQAVSSPYLKEIDISLRMFRRNMCESVRPAADRVEALFRLVSGFPRLQSFQLGGFWRDSIPSSRQVLSSSALLHLAPLHDLEKLLMPSVPIALAGANLEDFARAWPKITELCLYDRKPAVDDCRDPSFLQVDALLPFARFCPALRTLGLPMEISGETSYCDGDELPAPITAGIIPC